MIEWKTLWEMEKLLVTSNFSFSHNVFKSCLLLMRLNEYPWSKGLNLCQNTGGVQIKERCEPQIMLCSNLSVRM